MSFALLPDIRVASIPNAAADAVARGVPDARAGSVRVRPVLPAALATALIVALSVVLWVGLWDAAAWLLQALTTQG